MYTFEEDGAITFQDDRAHTYPWGVEGGSHAATSEKLLRRADGTTEELPSKAENVPVAAGDKLVFRTAGGGGLGDPLDRDAELVATEVGQGLVSASQAESAYGVVLAEDGSVDADATEARRAELREDRDELEAFDYGPLPDEETMAEEIAAEYDREVRTEVMAGHPTRAILDRVEAFDPNSVSIVTLFEVDFDRDVEVDPAYSGFLLPDSFFVGYGLDYEERYRDLRHLGVLNQELLGD